MLQALDRIPQRSFYLNRWRLSDEQVCVTTPVGNPIAAVGLANETHVDEAAHAASQAQVDWAAASERTRSAVMAKAADVLRSRRVAIAELLRYEIGATHARANAEIDRAEAELRHGARLSLEPSGTVLRSSSETSVAHRIPVGVVGVISPWNAPLVLALRSIVPALALGNAVIHKPDVRAPYAGGLVIAEIFQDAGLAPSVLHVLPGGPEVGNAIVEHPLTPVVSFTGSPHVGRKVGEVGGRALKRVCLELGGNNALIVLPDGDVEAAAAGGAHGTYGNQGQICMATGRHIVHESLYERYLNALCKRANSLTVGDPASEPVDVGPLIQISEARRVNELIEESLQHGARLVAGGTVSGPFVAPTVLADAGPGVPAFDQEVFGPVAAVTSYRTEDELIQILTASRYELSCAVWTSSPSRCAQLVKKIPAGCLHFNASTVRNDPDAPFGAFGLSGNGAYFGGPASIETFTRWRWVTVDGDRL